MDKLVKPMVETNGKGDKPRPVNKEIYDKNYEKIFNRTKKVVDVNKQKSNTKQKK